MNSSEGIRFEQPESEAHCYVVAFDTICEGQQAWTNGEGEISLMTRGEAEDDIAEMISEGVAEDGEYWLVHKDEYIHERRLVFGGEGFKITGTKPE